MKFAALATALLVTGASPALAREAYEGTWSCDGMSMSIEGNTWRPWGDTPPATITEVMNHGADYGFTLNDGYRFSLMNVTEASASWTSLESGDSFECRRVGETQASAAPEPTPVAAEPWNGMSSMGTTEGHVRSHTVAGATLISSCSDRRDNLTIDWEAVPSEGPIAISVDGAPAQAYTPEYDRTLTTVTPGYRDLVQALIAGNQVTVQGADGQVAAFTLSRSSRYLSDCAS